MHKIAIAMEKPPCPGEIYWAEVGTGKVRPVLIIGSGPKSFRYADLTTQYHPGYKQVRLATTISRRNSYVDTEEVYAADNSVLYGRIAYLSAEELRNIGFQTLREKPVSVKKTEQYYKVFGRRAS